MGFTIARRRRIELLRYEIHERRERYGNAPTYRDSANLRELYQIVEEQLNEESDALALSDSIFLLTFVAEAYSYMGRFSLSADCYTRVIHLARELKSRYGKDTDGITDILYALLKMRNAYVDDDCEDIIDSALYLIPEAVVSELILERKRSRRSVIYDPVEMSEEYLAVIDKVEERIENNRVTRGLGSCHEVWRLKREYLSEYGIVWRSAAELNPRMRFD